MTVKYFALLTNLGAAKLANAAALGTQLQITHMAVGDGGGVLPTPNPAQTQLLGEKRRAALNSLSIDEANSSQIIAEQVIPETDGGWWIREVGLFDKDGILIAIANCPDTYKPLLQEGSGRTQTVRMVLIVSSTEAVTLKIDPSVVLATRKYVDDKVIEVKTYADDLLAEHVKSRNHPDASKTEKGFVKLSSAITSDSEALAATPKAVKTVADNAAKTLDEHGKAENPHSQYLQMGQLTGVVGASRNAKMSIPTASTQATFTADELIVQTSLGAPQYKLTNLNKVINLATIGAGGLDTSTVPTSGFIAIYVIYSPSTQESALLAVNATATVATEICFGVMPNGYTASALVAVLPIAATKFRPSYLAGRSVSFELTPVYISSSISSSVKKLDISAAAPKNATLVRGVCSAGGASVTASYSSIRVWSSVSLIGEQEVRFGGQSGGGADTVGNFEINVIERQSLYFSFSSDMTGAISGLIKISTYEF